MKVTKINDTTVHCPEDITDNEIQQYIQHLLDRHPKRSVAVLKLTTDGEYVDIEYELSPLPFERIRRITGYLTGDVRSWNNAKRSELESRVKHCGVDSEDK